MTKARELRELAKMKRVDFCEKYGIPLRTMEDWEAEKSKAPQYVMDLLERAVRQDLGLQTLFYVYDVSEKEPSEEWILLKTHNIREAQKLARDVQLSNEREGSRIHVEIRRYISDIEDEDCKCWDYETVEY